MILSALDAIEETPIDRYLAAQRDLSAVERFSQRHETELEHRQSRYYRDLLPAAPPGPGQQYAFEVDLDTCTGCKACVVACHRLNGLDDGESWRSVSVAFGGTATAPSQQTITAACHHCLDPACLSGCPVDAYEKDPVTGIVMHLDDQCIGCSYCTLTCPYEVPVYNHDRGIVRKCDMCRGRLAVGEAPACVQSCPNEAIRISVVDVDAVRATAMSTRVPGGPPSALTTPSTVYRTTKVASAIDGATMATSLANARSHLPLVVMLVLTQLAVGAFVIDLVLRLFATGGLARGVGLFDALLTLAAGALALGASTLHLGRPRYAYRAVIGLRHSWLSREVVAFGAFTALAGVYALVVAFEPWPKSSPLTTALAMLVAVVGLVGVISSVLVYVVTRRSAWRFAISGPKFALTSVIGGCVAVWWASLFAAALAGPTSELRALGRPVSFALAMIMACGLTWEFGVWKFLVGRRLIGAHVAGDVRRVITARLVGAVLGGMVLPLVLSATPDLGVPGDAGPWLALGVGTIAFASVLLAELLERVLYFAVSGPPR